MNWSHTVMICCIVTSFQFQRFDRDQIMWEKPKLLERKTCLCNSNIFCLCKTEKKKNSNTLQYIICLNDYFVIPVDVSFSISLGCNDVSRGEEKDWACDMALTSERSLPCVGSHKMLLPTTWALPVTVIPLIASQKGWKPFNLRVRAILQLSFSSENWQDGVMLQGSSCFLVAFHNLKCSYHQWSAALLKSPSRTPCRGQNK